MLGWEILILRQDDEDSRVPLARWRAGLGGTKWIDDLVAPGRDGQQ